jgi:hypothetical protein
MHKATARPAEAQRTENEEKCNVRFINRNNREMTRKNVMKKKAKTEPYLGQGFGANLSDIIFCRGNHCEGVNTIRKVFFSGDASFHIVDVK